jgi:hypothetical protein
MKEKFDLVDLKKLSSKGDISFWLFHALRFDYVDSVSIQGNNKITVRINYESDEELKKKLSGYMYIINYFRKHQRVKSITIEKKKQKSKKKMWFGEISSLHGSHVQDVYFDVLMLKITINYKY